MQGGKKRQVPRERRHLAPAAADLMRQEASSLEKRQRLLKLKTPKQAENAIMETNAQSPSGWSWE